MNHNVNTAASQIYQFGSHCVPLIMLYDIISLCLNWSLGVVQFLLKKYLFDLWSFLRQYFLVMLNWGRCTILFNVVSLIRMWTRGKNATPCNKELKLSKLLEKCNPTSCRSGQSVDQSNKATLEYKDLFCKWSKSPTLQHKPAMITTIPDLVWNHPEEDLREHSQTFTTQKFAVTLTHKHLHTPIDRLQWDLETSLRTKTTFASNKSCHPL